MDDEIKPKSALSFLVDELWIYVLGFLSCTDILRCTSVCKALRQTYMSSSELQYIVELGGQCLLPTSNTDDHTPIYKRLQRLRDKAHAWLKFDAYAFQTVIPSISFSGIQKYITGEHFYMWNYHDNLVAISPIPSNLLSQRTIEHHWSPRTLCPFPGAERRIVLMDPAQNLFAIAYTFHGMTYIYLATLDDGCVHPHAAGPALVLDTPVYEWETKFQCYGRHIALWREFYTHEVGVLWPSDCVWQLQIWDWQHSTTLSSVLNIQTTLFTPTSFCFLGNDRLLVVADNLKLYSIKDMSETPRLLACFLLPFSLVDTEHYHPTMHGSQLRTQAQSMYTSDPEHRLLCLTSWIDKRTICLISTKIFFDIDEVTAITPIPWNHWGPGHIRVVEQKAAHVSITHVSGNRVLLADKMMSERHEYYKLRMMDFSPLAVTNRRGLGRVVKERSTVTVAVQRGPNSEWDDESKYYYSTVETALPYVEVLVSDRKISGLLHDVWMDGDRIYLLDRVVGGTFKPKLEVINIY
ncbi:uncharacterized protein HD556DRAFT_1417334 [Suillus plorans]|uniref:F-box domain-containing protein n=1 Tax=Suillus plorans TaxID=116603 RepID=A0A9P7DB14_9AGAM|nr:uncharacterized protein HD556DRAFT_1417334 [Suillus plorans]KAG1786079.1 hypothetical protein HD556DRAFT_1417334 [Suillus plorans]